MRTLILAAAMLLTGTGPVLDAVAQGRHDEKPHGMPSGTAPAKVPQGGIALKDGGTLIVGKDGVTYHMDATGKRVRMRNGQTMEAVDGSKYVMKNDAVWQTITEKGTMHPSH